MNYPNKQPLKYPVKLPVGDGLVLWLPFQEGTGRLTADISPFRENGTLQAGAGWNSAIGVSGMALECNGGATDYVLGSDLHLPSGDEDRTILLWMRITGLFNYHTFFFYGTQASNKGIYFGTGSTTQAADGPARLLFGIYGQNAPLSDTAFAVSSWHHAAVTLTGQTAEYFLNGVSDGGGAIATVPNTTLNQYLVAKAWSGTNVLRGQIRNIRVYSRVLSANEIRSIYEMESQ